MKIQKRLTVGLIVLLMVVFSVVLMTSCGECEHTWSDEVDVVEEATCKKAGTVIKTCTKCGFEKVDEITVPHVFKEYVNDNNATCSTPGTETAKCENEGCTATDKRAVAPLGHRFTVYEHVDATCTLPSAEVSLCDICGIVTDRREVANATPALGHDYADGFSCVVCGEMKDGMSFVTSYDISAKGDESVVAELYQSFNEKGDIKNHLFIFGSGEIRDFIDSKPEWYDSYRKKIVSANISNDITYLGQGTFANLTELANVTLPEGITVIPANCFNSCKEFTEITIPKGVTSIDELAFESCTKLSNVIIEEGSVLNLIGDDSFKDCSKLKSINLPESLKAINSNAFRGCSALKSIEIPAGLDFIANTAFFNTGLVISNPDKEIVGSITKYKGGRYLAIGDNPYAILLSYDKDTLEEETVEDKEIGVLTIHADTKLIAAKFFNGNSDIDLIRVEDGNTVFYAQDNCIISGNTVVAGIASAKLPTNAEITVIGAYAFVGCDDLTELVIPSNITYISNNAFDGCEKLETVTLPTGISAIGDSAFAGCKKLKTVKLAVEEGAEDTSVKGELVLPEGTTAIGAYAFEECVLIEAVKLPSTLEVIGNGAFSGCKKIKTVNLPEGLILIGDYAFEACESIKEITLPENVAVGAYAFFECEDLETINLPTIAYLGDYAFAMCTSIKAVVIPDTFENIGYAVFNGCKALKSVTLPFIGSDINGTVSDKFCYIFGNETDIPASVSSVTLTTVEVISAAAFENCTTLKEIHLPECITEIGESAFNGCINLKYIYIESLEAWCNISFADYNANPLYLAKNLYVAGEAVTNLVLPESVTSIGYATFAGGSFATVTLHENLESIAEGAFIGCTNLKSIVIPDSVTYIAAHAFAGCKALESITLSASLTAINEYTFISCENLQSIYIPASITDIDVSAFTSCRRLAYIGVAEENEVYSSVDGKLATKDGTVIYTPSAHVPTVVED